MSYLCVLSACAYLLAGDQASDPRSQTLGQDRIGSDRFSLAIWRCADINADINWVIYNDAGQTEWMERHREPTSKARQALVSGRSRVGGIREHNMILLLLLWLPATWIQLTLVRCSQLRAANCELRAVCPENTPTSSRSAGIDKFGNLCLGLANFALSYNPDRCSLFDFWAEQAQASGSFSFQIVRVHKNFS